MHNLIPDTPAGCVTKSVPTAHTYNTRAFASNPRCMVDPNHNTPIIYQKLSI